MKELGNKFPGMYFLKDKQFKLFTKNLVPGESVYGEPLVKKKGIEYRYWDPRRSKLAAAVLKKISQVGLKKTDNVLYLGASTGTTVSHFSDILGDDGFIFALDFAPRVVRELVFLCEKRKNIAPILGDANRPDTFARRIGSIDFVYQDVAQKNQAEIFLKNMRFLEPGAFGILCVKARSIDISRNPKGIYNEVRHELEKEITVVDFRTLDPFEKDHCMFVCKKI